MTAEKPGEIKALSGARAIPPLILVLFHFCEGHGYRGVPAFDLIVAKGYLWVEFFFALSGFILVYVYAPRWRAVWTASGYRAFLGSRLARLYPLHLFMLLAILAEVVVFGALARNSGYVSLFDQPYHPVLSWQTFVANLFLVQAWNLFPYLSWNQIAWFVSVEFLLCIFFPLYLLVTRGGRASGIFSVLAGIAGLAILAFTSRRGLDITFHNGIWRGAAGFAVGVGFATLFLSQRGTTRLSDAAHSAIQLVIFAGLLAAIWFTGKPRMHADLLTVLPMLALVPALASDRGVLAYLLKSKLTAKLGEWSYGIFIGQLFVMNLDRFFEERLLPAPQTIVLGMPYERLVWWIEPLALLLICIVWGALLTAAIERPANTQLRRLIARQGVPASAAA